VIHTGDGGASWSLQSSTLPNTLRGVSFSSSLVGTAVGLSGLILRTTNGGSTWSTQTSGTTYDLNGVVFTDDNTGWAVGYEGIFHTVNGGSTWTKQASASGEQQVGVSFTSSSVGNSIGAYGEVQRTANGGSSWSLQTEGIAAYNNDVAFFDANNGTIVAAAGIIVHTSNGGANWATQTSGTGNYLGGIAFSSASTAVAVGGANTILRTTNGGSTWALQTIGSGGGTPLSVSVNSAAVCSGGSATLTASPSGGTSPYTYSWSNGATTQSISVSTAGTYSVTVTDSKSATASGSGTLTVNPPPTVSVNSAAVCSGGSATLTASPSGGTSPYTYSWNTGATTQSISVSTGGTYSVTVTDSKGCTGSGSGSLTVNLPPAVTVNSLSVCGSISGTLTATAVGGSTPYSYSWNTGATTQSITVSTAGTYSVTVTDSKGCTGSGSGVFTVNPKPILVCSGDSLTSTKLTATTSVASTPSTGVSYAWSGTGLVSGGTTASATWNQPGSKTVVVTNTLTGCKDSCVSQVTQSLTPPPSAPVLSTPATGATNQPTSLTLSWNASSGATTYRVQVSTSSTFSPVLVDDSTVTTTSKAVSSFSNNTTYYWRVNAKNAGGTSAWSTAFNFVTVPLLPGVTTTAASSVTTSGATLNGNVNPNGASTTAWFEWGTSSTLSAYTSTTSQSLGSGSSGVAVNALLSGLTANTTYYYRAAGQNGAGTQKGVILSFTTGANLPTVTTSAAGSITTNSATLNGSVNPNGAATTAWFEWGTSSTLATFASTSSQSIGSGTSAVAVNAGLTGLAANTTYYYRAVGQNSAGTQRDGILSFTTGALAPTVSTTAASSVAMSGATLNGSVNPNGASTTAWFEWGTSSTLSTFTSTTSQSVGSGTSPVGVSQALTGLATNTTYYYRAAAQNAGGMQKDVILSFTTSANLPTVSTGAATSVTLSSATMNGTVNPNGAAATGWFEWGTSSTLSSFTSTTAQSLGSGTSDVAMSANLTGLSSNTTYYFRAAGQNTSGTQKDGILSFTTPMNPPSTPVLASPANGATNQPTSLTMSWNTSTGATGYHVQVSTNSAFSALVVDDSTVTSTSKVVSSLSNNTTYYWRVSARNSGGTSSYSSMWNYVTLPLLPAVVTTPASSVTSSSASMNGSVNPNGSSATGWFEWGTSSTLSTFTSTTAQSVGSGTTAVSFSANLTGLAPNTAYYYRAAGQNGAGTQKDAILSFTTTANLPTVTTGAPSSVTSNGATLNGSANPNGSLTTGWFEWGTSSTLSTFSSTPGQSLGSGTSAVSLGASLTGLSPNTTYYYRAAAQNASGTQKDGILSFTTGAVLPTVATGAASAVTSSSATMNGSVNPNGSSATAWFEWGTSSTLSTFTSTTAQSVGSGTTAVSFSANLTGLTPNTTYYCRAAGQNGAGTQKDVILSFTTGIAAPAAPVLASPADGSVDQPTTLTLSWNASTGAASYRLQLSTSSTFSTLLVDDATLTGTSKVVGPLANATYFYWRVNATNAGGTSAYSEAGFTTTGGSPLFSVSPTSLSFGNVPVGAPVTDTLTVTNSGAATLSLDTIYSTSTKYTVIPKKTTVAAGTSQMVFVTFSPTNKSIISAQVIFKYNATGSPDTVPVTGKGVSPPRVRKNVTVISFGAVAPGDTKKDSFSLLNIGATNVVVSSVVSTDSIFTATPTTATILPSDSQWFYVSVTPVSTQPESGYIVINYADGSTPDSILVQTDQVSGVKVIVGIPAELALRQNYPNPFNPTTTIGFDIPEPSIVTLKVYNVIGQEVATLLQGNMQAGYHSIEWNANTADLGPISTGVYMYRLNATSLRAGQESSQVRKMTYLK
jgi:phosphodiesterase/alkaline phosphatase D-like protein